MRATHFVAIVVAIALVIVLYMSGNTIPPPKAKVSEMQRPGSGGAVSGGPAKVAAASFDSILVGASRSVSKNIKDSVLAIEHKLDGAQDPVIKSGLYMQLSRVWEHAGRLPVAAYYSSKSARLENSEKKLTFAGQFFLQLMENESSSSVQAWEAAEAVSCLEQSLKLNPDNEDTKLALATGYIEGTGEPMRGVQILLAIVREKPDDIPANMLLGRMAIQSGQYDKAIGRYETVLKLEPENKEALYFLAQASEGKGDKKRAIELLEKCKKLVSDPAFSKEIDDRINSLK